MLAQGLTQPTWIAVDERNVYWTDHHGILTIPKRGGPMVVLADAIASPAHLASDGRHVYWLDGGSGRDDGTLARVPVEGGEIELVATDLPARSTFALDAEFLYWSSGEHLMRAPKSGGLPEIVSTHTDISALAVDDTAIYWANTRSSRMPWIAMAGLQGRERVLVSESPPGVTLSIAVADRGPCWTSWSDVTVAGVWCLDTRTTAPRQLAQAKAWALSVHDGLLFWIRGRDDDDADVVCTPTGGGASAILASGQIADLAVDSVGVYYTDIRGSVFVQEHLAN